MSNVYFARAGRASHKDLGERIPELAPLRESTICMFGVGCLGAPSVLEFARCGIKELRIVDPDFVDPATICRWPLGLQAVGLFKVAALAQEIARNYPFTDVKGYNYYVGGVRNPDDPRRSDQSIMRELTTGAQLIFDATAEVGVQQYLSEYAVHIGVPYVGVHSTPGGWGGTVIRITPAMAACWMCYQFAMRDKTISEPPSHPSGQLQPVGCADPTFIGTGFDMLQIAIPAVRLAVSTLCAGSPGGYPATNWDVMTVALRNTDGALIPPTFRTFELASHAECSRCNPP